MDRFSKFNPKVTFLFFVLIIILTLIFFHPVYLTVSLVAALCYKIKLDGKKGIEYFFKYILPLILFVAVFNMLFTHYGATVLFTAFDMRFTLEGLFYGLCQGMMFSSVIVWFSCYSAVVTSERFLSVFGRIAPNCVLVFSMVLSFIPRLKKNAYEINDSRMLLDKDKSKLKKSLKSFSALLTMTLEESIEVSDSMKARGFGSGRTAYSKYRFSLNDGICLIFITFVFILLCVMKALGKITFIFDPAISMESFSVTSLVMLALISFLPLIIDFTEDIRWFYLKQKI
ncbi:MAG: energy-coupling factor transporter transmembrane component T [Eubacterium sp.]